MTPFKSFLGQTRVINSILFFRPRNSTDCIDDSDASSFESAVEQSEQQDPAPRRYPLRERKPRTDVQSFLAASSSTSESKRKRPAKNDDDLDKLDALYSWYKWSDCKMAQRYDKERNFFPQPGPSNLNYYEEDDIVGYYRPVSDAKTKKAGATRSNAASSKKDAAKSTEKKTPPKTRGRKRNDAQSKSPIPKEFQWHSDNSDWEDDIQVQSALHESIYEQSFAESLNATVKDSPGDIPPTPPSKTTPFVWNGSNAKKTPKNMVSFLDQTIPTPVLSKFMENLKTAASNEANDDLPIPKSQEIRIIGQCTITPLEIAPQHSDIVEVLDKHELPKMVHPIPHYSDPNDLLADNSKKEVGHTILQLHGNAVNDCEEFQSELSVNGLAKWQRYIAQPNSTSRATRNANSKALENAGKCRKLFAREQLTKITPNAVAPTHSETIDWLKERTRTNTSNNNTKKRSSTSINDYESVKNPAKVQRSNSVLNQNGSQEKDDLVSKLLAKNELTITRITRSTKKDVLSQSTEANQVQKINNNNNYKYQNDTDDDDVIILSDNLPAKQAPVTNSFNQVGRLRRIHLK